MNIADIKSKLQTFIDDTTDNGVAVVFANQNAPRPKGPYITIHITAIGQKEFGTIGEPNTDGDAEIVNDQEISVSLQAFGENAYSIMGGLRSSLDKVSVLQSLRAVGLLFIRVLNGVNDMSQTIGTKYEERAGMDLAFRAANVVSDHLGTIESVEGVGTHDTGKNENFQSNFQVGA